MATPAPPIVRNQILIPSNYLVKPIFQEEFKIFECNKTFVKYKKERKRTFETKNMGENVSHSEKKQ